MEQGTGKAYVGLAEAEALHAAGAIDALVVVAPNGVHLNWTRREAPKLLSTPFLALEWTGADTQKWQRTATTFVNTRTPALRILAFNVEAFSQRGSRAERFLVAVLKRLRCLMAIDESSVIKNFSGVARTRNMIRIGRGAAHRAIFTGTPVTQSPLNLYSQFDFLQPGLLGFTQFTPFKAHYAEWRLRVVPSRKKGALPGTKQEFYELVKYRNLTELKARVDAHAYTVTKRECLDLPPKVYEERLVLPTPQQRAIYAAARKEFLVELGRGRMTIAHVMTRTLRLAQITGGHVRADEDDEALPIPGGNPKLDSLLQLVEELPAGEKLIVWARFLPELRAIADALGRHRCALYWGEVGQEERSENIDAFMTSAECRFFVGNPKSGKYGFTLTAASHVAYFSNDFSAEARWQSEDRAHRIGQTESVTYYDLLIPNTIDGKILRVLRERASMADLFKGDAAAIARWLTEEEEEEPNE